MNGAIRKSRQCNVACYQRQTPALPGQAPADSVNSASDRTPTPLPPPGGRETEGGGPEAAYPYMPVIRRGPGRITPISPSMVSSVSNRPLSS